MTQIEPMTTYEAWREIVLKAQSEVADSKQAVYIHFRKSYGWATSFLTAGDHYATAIYDNHICINKTVAKKLGRLWLR
jgi:hypothetical protein